MDSLKSFDIEFIKYKTGEHSLFYKLDAGFLRNFEYGSLKEGQVEAQVEFIKHMHSLEFKFNLDGEAKVTCDRCLNEIMYPIVGDFHLLVKITDEPGEEEDNLTYIPPSAFKFNIAQYLYEIMHLSLPMKVTCEDLEDDEITCNEEVIKKLEEIATEEEPDSPDLNADWEKIKKLFNDN